jgi:DNA-directed RNA polymerase subunit M/transcription elongation factor TFIIS
MTRGPNALLRPSPVHVQSRPCRDHWDSSCNLSLAVSRHQVEQKGLTLSERIDMSYDEWKDLIAPTGEDTRCPRCGAPLSNDDLRYHYQMTRNRDTVEMTRFCLCPECTQISRLNTVILLLQKGSA